MDPHPIYFYTGRRLKLTRSFTRLDHMLAPTILGLPPLAVHLRPLRHQRGWTQQELARRSGVDQPTISRIENGGTRGVGLGTIERLAYALNVNPHVLFERPMRTAS